MVVAALIARELGGDARAQALTAGAQATALWTTLAGHWLTPYTLEPVQWLLLGWLLFGHLPGLWAWVGMGLIVLCGATLVWLTARQPKID